MRSLRLISAKVHEDFNDLHVPTLQKANASPTSMVPARHIKRDMVARRGADNGAPPIKLSGHRWRRRQIQNCRVRPLHDRGIIVTAHKLGR